MQDNPCTNELHEYRKITVKYSEKIKIFPYLGHCITVYADHNNLTFENFTTERVLRWRIILECRTLNSGPYTDYNNLRLKVG